MNFQFSISFIGEVRIVVIIAYIILDLDDQIILETYYMLVNFIFSLLYLTIDVDLEFHQYFWQGKLIKLP